MKIINVKTDSKNYEIKVGDDLLGSIPLKKLVSEKDIFEQDGEDYFRQKESEALSETKTLRNVVIATGGGIVEKEENRLFLKNEDKVIFLDSTPERQYERTKDSKKRPLLNDGDSLEILKKLYEKRFNFYEAVSKIKISMDNLNTEEILKKIIKFLNK